MDEVKLTRNELYEQVWSEPMRSLAKKYNISDVGLRKICKKMNIPTPGVGYWQKLEYGKRVIKPKLSDHKTGKQEVIISLEKEARELASKSASALSIREKKLKTDPDTDFKVPARLVNPDPMIIAAQESLTKKDSHYREDNLRWTHEGGLDIAVTPNNINRALRFMDTVIKLLRRRGHVVTIKNNSTYAIVEGEEIQIKLREKIKRETNPDSKSFWDRYQYHPSGLLSFRLEHFSRRYKIIDGKLLLEERLPRIIARLENLGQVLKQERIEREKYWAEQKEKERIRQEHLKRKEKEIQDFKALLKKAQRWDKAETIRRFIEASISRASEKGICSDEQKSWYEWAMKKADWYDPFIEAEDELMRGVDRDKIEQPEESTKSRLFW